MTIHKTISPGLWGLTALLLALALTLVGCDVIKPDEDAPPLEGPHPVLIDDGFRSFIKS